MNFSAVQPNSKTITYQAAEAVSGPRLRSLLAPVVDLVIILLALAVIAMATNRRERETGAEGEIRLTLPASDHAAPMRRGLREIVVNIDSEGRLFLNGQMVEPAELTARFERAANVSGETDSVLIRADSATPHRHIVGVLTACQRAGLRAISIATQPVGSLDDSESAP